MTTMYHRPKGFKRCIIQRLGAAITGDSATDTFTADAAHGQAVGDCVACTTVGGSGLSLLTRYYVANVADSTHLKLSATRGGAAMTLGNGTDVVLVPLVEHRLFLANKAAFNAKTKTASIEGDDLQIDQEALQGLTVTLDFMAVNTLTHASLFSHTAVGIILPGGINNAYGFGGGDDVAGVSCGARLEADAIKVVNGVESNVTFFRWHPMATLTLLKAGDFQTGQPHTATQYSLSVSRTKVDLFGAAIPNASADGDFWFDGDSGA